jgi:hypothetical protein
MYRQPVVLTPERAHTRIFAPIAYEVPRKAQIVPIVAEEAASLAAWFPVVWQRIEDRFRLVAVRSMLSDGAGQPSGSPRTAASLPLLLRAYPFLLDQEGGERRVLFDDVIADEPTDVGAPIMTVSGQLSRGSTVRLQMLSRFAKAQGATEDITIRLAAGGLLEPWRFEHKAENGQTLAVPDLFMLRSDAASQTRLRSVIRAAGAPAVALLGAPRLSLFRAGPLVRAALRARASAPGEAA